MSNITYAPPGEFIPEFEESQPPEPEEPPLLDDIVETPPDPWKAYTLADAFKEREPAKFIVNGLFRLPSVNIVYGAPGALKSLLLADLCICVAMGKPWLEVAPWQEGGKAYATIKAPVMWIDFDNGEDRTHEHFEAVARAHQADPNTTSLVYYSMPNPWLKANKSEQIGQLINRIKARGSKFIVIDNLGTVRGDADENSGEMQDVMNNFRLVAQECQCAIILIHHQRKTTGIAGRDGDKLRGFSGIEAALDLALLLDREPLSDTVDLTATKTRGADVYPFKAAFSFTQKDNDELYEARFFSLDAEDKKSDKAIDIAIVEAVKDVVCINKSDLTNKVKVVLPDVGLNRVRNRIDVMASLHKVKMTIGARTEKLYGHV